MVFTNKGEKKRCAGCDKDKAKAQFYNGGIYCKKCKAKKQPTLRKIVKNDPNPGWRHANEQLKTLESLWQHIC